MRVIHSTRRLWWRCQCCFVFWRKMNDHCLPSLLLKNAAGCQNFWPNILLEVVQSIGWWICSSMWNKPSGPAYLAGHAVARGWS